ncbi:unnamed protein product [Candida verbasci]|uniref:PAN2-PAN3 deadenylation complex subunit PAN3 n=1 Tax=Candida verbasci TaxID=1227364 RepID=A0A9W4TY52_9ASCO|nr:unnamed protein product [Candida verbasci]
MNINLDTAKDILCKNILIYGYCKFENKGCVFNHNRQQQNKEEPKANDTSIDSHPHPPSSSDGKKKFNLNTPSFQPSNNNSVSSLTNKFSNLTSPKIKDLPSFKPETSSNNEPFGSKRFNISTPSFTPSSNFDFNSNTSASPSINNLPQVQQQQPQPPNSASSSAISSIPQQSIHVPPQVSQAPPPQPPHQEFYNPQIPLGAPLAARVGPGQVPHPPPPQVQIQQTNQTQYPLQYHLYAPTPPPRLQIPLQKHETNSSILFIPNNLREYLHKKNESSLQILNHSNLPDHINYYHSLVPIDKSYEIKSKIWNKNSIIFKCYSNLDGNLYVMRKIEPVEILSDKPFKTIKKWISRIKGNSNIVELKDCFTTMNFGNYSSLCMIYDYFPNSITVYENHKKGLKLEPVTEDLLWNYLIQLINAIKFVHENNLAVKSSLNLSKIIITNKDRIRISSIGISDILEREKDNNYEESKEIIEKSQLEDIHNLGKLLFDLSVLLLPINVRNLMNLNLIELRHFNQLRNSTNLSELWCNTLEKLIYADETFTLSEFNTSLTTPMLSTINNLQQSNDFFENQLMTELENARLFRLMTKINFIIFNSTNVSQIKILKLFQHYLFNTYDINGKKQINLSKILINLNKLDCGIDEKILLVSNNQQECIIVSYKEIKELIDSQFRLMRE